MTPQHCSKGINSSDILAIRSLLGENNSHHHHLSLFCIKQSVDKIRSIIIAKDTVMVARNDDNSQVRKITGMVKRWSRGVLRSCLGP